VSERALGLIVAGSVPLAMFIGSLSPVGEVGLVLMVAVLIWASRQMPEFRWELLRGATAGALAGVVVLGPGLRLAMRMVAIAEPDRQLEFTSEGTIFIVVGIGLVFGLVAGAYLVSVGRLLGLRRVSTALAAMVALMVILFGDSELRSELTDLGLGGWVNIPMFGSVVFGYGWAVDVVADRLERRRSDRRSMEPSMVS
jgi:hypothetical protein